MFNDFKKFINQGNVIELAVGFIIATAFAAVVKSLVDNVIMPPIGALLGGSTSPACTSTWAAQATSPMPTRWQQGRR